MSAPPAKKQRAAHVVYQLQIAVDVECAREFESWLHSNLAKVFDLPKCDFESAEVYVEDPSATNATARRVFAVQYRVEDRAGLDKCLQFDAPTLPDDVAPKFKDKIAFTRRIFRSAVANGSHDSNGRRLVTFVTGSKKKLEEVVAILADGNRLPCDITNAKLDLPELQGEPEEVAAAKVKLAAKEIGGAAMTEDTSLCFNALQGLPGVYIKWFMEKVGNDGLNNILASYPDKTGYAQCIFAYCAGPDEEAITFVGRTAGKIVPARGSLGFGWDPVFEPDESGGKTFAEMTQAEKNAISHRGRALAKVKEFFMKNES